MHTPIMFRLILCTLFLVTVSGGFQLHNEKVLGGENATIEEIPYQAAIFNSGEILCGGTILSENVVVSAANCVYGEASSYSIRIGTNLLEDPSSQYVSVSHIIVHEDYDDWNVDFDVALFFTNSSLLLDGIKARAINLPVQGQNISDGTLGVVSGWGVTEELSSFLSPFLQKVSIPTINQDLCISIYSIFPFLVSDQMICAGFTDVGGKDVCWGDAGGPLVVDSELIGIASWGVGCGQADFPRVWTRVSSIADWIKLKMSENQTIIY